MYSRREFVKTASLATGALAMNLQKLSGGTSANDYFGLNDFIDNHPDAVFILRTTVDSKTNAAAIKEVGRQLGQTLFISKAAAGFPLSTKIAIKPNLTAWAWDIPPIETTMGIHTDANFVEGVIDSFKNLGVAGSSVYIREANYTGSQPDAVWYKDMAARSGINLKDCSPIDALAPGDVQWADVPNGVWYKSIPYLWPVHSPGSCLINIAKLKSHSMGMTLCSKNLQGTNARPYVAHCTAWGATMSGVDKKNVIADASTTIKANYDRHVLATLPRWETPGTGASSGLGMETHSSRCLDNNAVLQPLINIIEGVYGREGPFVSGPADNNGYGRDVMVNIVIFGKNARHVDIVGTYLAGHEPGNFGFFHMARERGLSKYLDPRTVPLYEWKLDGSATLASLDAFARVPIRTLYLRKAGEDKYHLVNEPYDYTGTTVVRAPKYNKPDVFSICQNYPNPFNPSTSIQYYLPSAGNVRIDIFDVRGELVDVVVDTYMQAGDHLSSWNSERRASGVYIYRMLYQNTRIAKSMVLLK
ncbi:MAG: DUF362 domain-containing protein [Ignavibacteriales bacterium]|nr:DUF362 domain-containing protein [Ignavibacteriales bacterium]